MVWITPNWYGASPQSAFFATRNQESQPGTARSAAPPLRFSLKYLKLVGTGQIHWGHSCPFCLFPFNWFTITPLTNFTVYHFSKINADSSAQRIIYITPSPFCNCDGHAERIFLKKYFLCLTNWTKSTYNAPHRQKLKKSLHSLCRGLETGKKPCCADFLSDIRCTL